MRNAQRWLLLGLLSAGLALGTLGGTRGEDKPKEEPGGKVPSQATFDLASQAYLLALEGQRRQSPVLMIAAVELLGDLKEARGKLKGVKSALEGKAKGESDLKPLPANSKEWIELAREYAKPDKELSAFLEKRLEKLGGRGLIYAQGSGLKTIDRGKHKYKVVYSNVLQVNQYYKGSNIRFDPNKVALIGVIYEPGSNLQLEVTDGTTSQSVGKIDRGTGGQVVAWVPTAEKPHTVIVRNLGSSSARFVVMANWDY